MIRRSEGKSLRPFRTRILKTAPLAKAGSGFVTTTETALALAQRFLPRLLLPVPRLDSVE